VRDTLSERIDLPKRPQATRPPQDGFDLLAPAHVGLSARPIYVARIPAAPILRGEATPTGNAQRQSQQHASGAAYDERYSTIAAALEAGLMEQEQRYPCSAVLP